MRAQSVLWLLTLATACGNPSPSSPLPAECSLIAGATADYQSYAEGIYSCPECGGNSPDINRFPINGLSSKGCRNADGLFLIAGSFETKSESKQRCNGSTLSWEEANEPLAGGGTGTVHDRERSYELITGHYEGHRFQKDCEGGDLIGGTFRVAGKDLRRINIAISGIGLIPRKSLPGLLAYRLTSGDGLTSLCQPDAAKPWLQSRRLPTRWPSNELELSEYVTVVPAPIFDRGGRPLSPGPVAFPDPREDRWFNLACADDGLAKVESELLPGKRDPRSFLVDTIFIRSNMKANADLEGKRRGALNMLTANYCGRGKYTRHGLDFERRSKRRSGSFVSTIGAIVDDVVADGRGHAAGDRVEAVWDAGGVVCASHSRLWQRGVVVPENRIPPGCAGLACAERQFLDAIASECAIDFDGNAPGSQMPPCECDTATACFERYPNGLWVSILPNHLD